MDYYKHTGLLILQSAELTGRTPFCPENQVIASYFDGGLGREQRDTLERHLADCRFCLARIGILNRLQTEGDAAPVSEEDLAAAKLLARKAPARNWRRMGQLAAAAVIVLGVALVLNTRLMTVETPGAGPVSDPVESGRQLRSIDRNATRLEVLIDAPSGAVTPGSAVRWAEVSGSIHYNIHVLSADGDVLLTERAQVTEWTLPGELQLNPGSDYFLRIEAVLPDGGTLNSRHIRFKAAEWR